MSDGDSKSLFPALDVLDHLHSTWRGSRFVSGAEADGERALNELVLCLPSLIAIAHDAAEVLEWGDRRMPGQTQALDALKTSLAELSEELASHGRV